MGNNQGSANTDSTMETRILAMVKKTLTDVARDTQTPPGMRHPLSEQTINNIRDCLNLIVAREQELQAQTAEPSLKPRFADTPDNKQVIVKLDTRKPGK
jgi:hypothetical protein